MDKIETLAKVLFWIGALALIGFLIGGTAAGVASYSFATLLLVPYIALQVKKGMAPSPPIESHTEARD